MHHTLDNYSNISDSYNFDYNYMELRSKIGKAKAGHDQYDGVKDVFNDACKELEIDTNLLKRIRVFQIGFVNRDRDSIEFFGGNLTGVHTVRFLQQDKDKWFDEVIEVDDGQLGERLTALPDINRNWFISSDTMNLSCVWLTHVIYNSKKLTEKEKNEGMINILLILQYKYLTSILYNSFRYPADKAIAEATYAQLSYKFALKQYGSWNALLIARAEEIISEKSIHIDTIRNMHYDERIVYMLNDVQGRIKDITKNIIRVHYSVKESGQRIHTSSSVMTDHEGEEILKDRTHHMNEYTRYINSIIHDKNSFIKQELTDIIESLIHTMPSKLFLMTLEWMSNNYRQSGANEIEEIINNMIIYTFSFINENKDLIKKESDLAILLSKLKGSIMSSRNVDNDLSKVKEQCEDIVKKATSNTNPSVIASVRTGVLLYCILRCLVKNHYS